jgi:hypothetical protein
MADWRSAPPPWTSPVILDSCSLKRGRRVSRKKREYRTKARTFAKLSAVNGGEVGDEGEESGGS